MSATAGRRSGGLLCLRRRKPPEAAMPPDRDQKLDAAVTALQQGRHGDAEALCSALVDADAGDAEAWSFLGLARLGRDLSTALPALAEAVRLEPSEPRWHMNQGIGLARAGRHAEAERAHREAVTRSGGAVDTLLPWAQSLAALGRDAEAVAALRRLAGVAPSKGAWRLLSRLLARQGDLAGAVDAIERLHGGRPLPADDALRVARYEMQLQRFDAASDRLTRLRSTNPDEPGVALAAAELERARGNLERADALLAEARAKRPDEPALIHAIVQHAGQVDADVLARGERLAADESLDRPARRAITFALARYYDRNGDPARAWPLAQAANRLYDDGRSFDRQRWEATLAAAIRLRERLPPVEPRADAPALVYLVGPPRSGGTLLQTLLAAAPGVASVGERGALLPWLLPLAGTQTATAAADWRARVGMLRDADLAGLAALDPDASTYVDKTPHHAHVAGLVERVHPGARFVDVRRDPAETALSIWFHDFPPAFDYAHRLEDIADYLEFHRQALARWQDAGLPVTVHDHDRFVANPEGRGRALFDELGLPWDDAWLDPAARRAPVQTFSERQVRRSVGAEGGGRVRRYEEYAGEALERLASLADT